MKNMHIKKLLFAMVALLCSVAASAYDFEVGGIFYNVTSETNSEIEVTYKGSSYNEYSNEYSGDVVIPSSVSYNGKTYSVISIGESAFEGCDGLTSITIPNSVTSIGIYAFCGCSRLTSITIPNSVTSIGEGAFYDCSGLTSITIPNSVTSIGSRVFLGCKGLTSVTIPNSVTSIELFAFRSCSSLTSITIPNSVTSIGGQAFYYCSGLDTVTSLAATAPTLGGNNVFANTPSGKILRYPAGSDYSTWEQYFAKSEPFTTTIAEGTCGNNLTWVLTSDSTLTISGTGAMADYDEDNRVPWSDVYESIKKVIIEEGITSIGKWAFLNCDGITSVTIPNSVTAIGDAAFAHCYSLTSVTIPNSVTTIKEDAFYSCKGITSIVVNEGNSVYDSRDNCNAIIKTSTNELIQGCKNTTIPNSVTTIGNKAFNFCDGLTNITIPNSVTSIGEYAFSLCDGLTSVTFPNSVTTIGQAAFAQCEGLTNITIPSSVTSIGFQAFAGCNNIVNITSYIPIDGLFPISVHTFGEVDKGNCTLYVPYGSKATYAATDGWNEFTNIVEMESTTPVTISVDSISTPPGRSITLPVGMANSEAVTAFQIDLELPEGIEFVSATLSDERKTTSHTISTSVLANGKRRIIAYSNENKAFKLSEGTLLNINLDIPKEAENGDYGVNISNIRLVKPDSKEILLDPVTANITVKEVKGDANNDFDVTMGDVVAVANYILELFVGTFNIEAADINGDGEITMGDLVAIINIILYPEDYDYGRNAKRGVIAASGSALSMPDTRSTDEAVSVPVSLSSTMAYTAFQMDIELPEGAKLTSAALTERAAAHSVAWSCLPDGKMRVVAYSLDNEVFSGNAGELVALNIEAEGAVSGAISVENVLMVTATGDEYAIGNCGSLLDINGTTGIDSTDGNGLKVYTADGALIVESGKAINAVVYSVSGKLVKTIDVAEGKNVYEGIPAGTYVVAGVKVAIK